MDSSGKKRGKVEDIMYRDCFPIHGLMFNVRDLIQCLFYCSSSMYHAVQNSKCNGFMITIDTERNWIMAVPVVYCPDYSECIVRNNDDPDVLRPHVNKNTYIEHDENKTILMVTKGYVIDNFKHKESYHDFLVGKNDSTVLIEASDIECLTDKNPYLE